MTKENDLDVHLHFQLKGVNFRVEYMPQPFPYQLTETNGLFVLQGPSAMTFDLSPLTNPFMYERYFPEGLSQAVKTKDSERLKQYAQRVHSYEGIGSMAIGLIRGHEASQKVVSALKEMPQTQVEHPDLETLLSRIKTRHSKLQIDWSDVDINNSALIKVQYFVLQ